MDTKTLKTSSVLAADTVGRLFSEFRARVDERRKDVRQVVEAFSSQDPEAFMKAVEGRLDDGAFDTAMSEAFERGEIDPDLYHGMMFSLLEAASFSIEHDADGHSFTTTELFALPITGAIGEILEVTGSYEMLAKLASIMSSSGYVSEGVQIILSPTTIDPRAAARLTCAVAREMAEAFAPHFDHGYNAADAEDLFEAVQGPFEFLGDLEIDHLAEKGRVTRLVIGATRRIHSPAYPTMADAFIANFIDENEDGWLQEVSDRFLETINASAPGTISFNMPLPITRAAAFAALCAAMEGLNDEAHLLGIHRPDLLMDEISINRSKDSVLIEGVVAGQSLGPVIVPDLLVRRDRLWFRNNLGRLCDDLHENAGVTQPRRLN
jgi:hypothetical protein